MTANMAGKQCLEEGHLSLGQIKSQVLKSMVEHESKRCRACGSLHNSKYLLIPMSTQCMCTAPENAVHAMCVPAAMDDPHTESLQAMNCEMNCESLFLCATGNAFSVLPRVL